MKNIKYVTLKDLPAHLIEVATAVSNIRMDDIDSRMVDEEKDMLALFLDPSDIMDLIEIQEIDPDEGLSLANWLKDRKIVFFPL